MTIRELRNICEAILEVSPNSKIVATECHPDKVTLSTRIIVNGTAGKRGVIRRIDIGTFERGALYESTDMDN